MITNWESPVKAAEKKRAEKKAKKKIHSQKPQKVTIKRARKLFGNS
jgi:hypothetical protein